MKKVYVVDDSALIRERLIELLSEVQGIQVIGETGDPYEANRVIGELSPDAVILDIRLPGKSGIEVLKEIRKNNKSTIVIMVTNYVSSHYRKICMDSGADYFLNKTTEFNKVTTLLKDMEDVNE